MVPKQAKKPALPLRGVNKIATSIKTLTAIKL